MWMINSVTVRTKGRRRGMQQILREVYNRHAATSGLVVTWITAGGRYARNGVVIRLRDAGNPLPRRSQYFTNKDWDEVFYLARRFGVRTHHVDD